MAVSRDIPVELLEYSAESLAIDDVLALSQSCQGLHTFIASGFAKTHVRDAAFVLFHRESMAKLHILPVLLTYSKEVRNVRFRIAPSIPDDCDSWQRYYEWAHVISWLTGGRTSGTAGLWPNPAQIGPLSETTDVTSTLLMVRYDISR